MYKSVNNKYIAQHTSRHLQKYLQAFDIYKKKIISKYLYLTSQLFLFTSLFHYFSIIQQMLSNCNIRYSQTSLT